ncbi:hypothetical protein CORC01_07536 [Colletotrichum orchidophilum]|uniref:Uncharacterized protein n=1 Tax=Colletotrichum orchidophilum TaxID=1209926 RepID=A0A1G4B749_9PEZI|nr:uncharacterized protein CORC01_07536 [Colletotrichum orchidophilum]OHE97095.1 hypothetical protein CORC01_07536 [Colletotrichum orchidophilum]
MVSPREALGGLITVFTVLAVGANGQKDNTVEWTLGMPVNFFATAEGQPCAASFQNAKSDATNFTPVQSSPSTVMVGGTAADLATTFYLTNGILAASKPFTDATGIRVAAGGSGGGCWDTSSGTLQVSACNLTKTQTFYVGIPGDNQPFYIFTSSLAVLDKPATAGDALTLNPAAHTQFCAYSKDTGKLVVAPANATMYYPQAQLTNLTSLSFGPTAPQSEGDVPECRFADQGNTSAFMLESMGSTDCIVARSFATIPGVCGSNPSNKTCILHLWPAFCLDLPEVRAGANASDALEVCVKKISQGPCIANPSGAACASNLFAGIQYAGGIGGGGGSSGSTVSKRQTSNDPLFGNPQSDSPLEDQFWMGVMKNVINSAIGAFKFVATPHIQELRVTCMGMTHLTRIFEASLGETIRKGCIDAFRTFDGIHELTYDNDIEKAGSILADVVGLLSLVKDVATAAKAVGAVDAVLAKFGKTAATVGKGKGLMLEAKEGENTVQIFRDTGDGKPKLLYTDSDVAAMEKSIEEGGEYSAMPTPQPGFENCKVCIEGGVAKVRRQKGIFRKLCCFLSPQTLEAPESVWNDRVDLGPGPSGANLPANSVIAALSETAALTADEKTLMTTMSEGFANWYTKGQTVSANVDEISSVLLEARKNARDWGKIASATSKAYGLSDMENWALETWIKWYNINPELDSALSKLPAATGLVIRSTDLNAATVNMLNKLESGVISKGTPGIYEVQDLVLNAFTQGGGGRLRKIMSTTLNLGDGMFTTTADYLFVINSKSGRYIEAVANSEYRETSFVQGISGKFKLIGKQELNGGEAAKAAGLSGPYAVYYFDEIEVPASTATTTVADIRKALTDAGVKLPQGRTKRGLDGILHTLETKIVATEKKRHSVEDHVRNRVVRH